MKASSRVPIWSIPAVLFVFACALTPPPPTAVPSGGTIFQDDFSNKDGDWDVLSDEFGTTAYGDGNYVISVTDTMSYLIADPEAKGDFSDVRIDVDVVAGGGTVYDAGIVCRHQDDDNFYYLLISSDGYYAIAKFKDGESSLIGMEEMSEDTDGAINTDGPENHIRAECIGSKLALYANGEKLFETTDTDFTGGTVGLIAGSYDDAPVTVTFDNFVVTKP
jgi:hypothetical protein